MLKPGIRDYNLAALAITGWIQRDSTFWFCCAGYLYKLKTNDTCSLKMNECDSAYVADIIAIPEIDGTCFQMVIDDNLHTYIQVFNCSIFT